MPYIDIGSLVARHEYTADDILRLWKERSVLMYPPHNHVPLAHPIWGIDRRNKLLVL